MKKLITGIIAIVVIVVGFMLWIGEGLKKGSWKRYRYSEYVGCRWYNYKNHMSYNDYGGVTASGTSVFFIFNAKCNGTNSNHAYNGLNTKYILVVIICIVFT